MSWLFLFGNSSCSWNYKSVLFFPEEDKNINRTAKVSFCQEQLPKRLLENIVSFHLLATVARVSHLILDLTVISYDTIWASYVTSLSLSSLIWKTGRRILNTDVSSGINKKKCVFSKTYQSTGNRRDYEVYGWT